MEGKLDLVTIHTVQGELSARVIKSRLESEGIPAMLKFETYFNLNAGVFAPFSIAVPREFVRDAKMVVDEMEYYIKKYQAENFVFSDLTAVVSKKCIVDLCQEIIDRQLNVTWQLPTLRTEAVDYEVLQLMYEAGCRELDFAIESGSKEVLNSVNKKSDPDKIFALIKNKFFSSV